MIPIARPLADRNTIKRIQKLIKQKSESKQLHRGFKHSQKALLNGRKGIFVLAADTTPMDLITHIPIVCERKGIPYIFVNSISELSIIKNEINSCCFIEISDEVCERTEKIIGSCTATSSI